MKSFAAMAKALADEGRVRILRALDRENELCACQLTALLELAASTVSKHLAILKRAGLLRSKKAGTWIFYALNLEAEDPRVRQWLEFAAKVIRTEPEYKRDKERLRAIKKIGPEVLCAKQRGC